MLWASRSRRGPDRFYRLKLALFVLAGALILLGVRLENTWVIWSAVGVLLLAVGLRVLGRAGSGERAANGSDDLGVTRKE